MDRFHSTAISKESSIVFRKPIFNSARCSATKSSSDCTERRKQQQQQQRRKGIYISFSFLPLYRQLDDLEINKYKYLLA